MAKKIAQIRATELTSEKDISSNYFSKYMPITVLGIQEITTDKTRLGTTKLYINNSTEPVQMSYTGLFYLDLTDFSQISSLSIERIDNKMELLIDMIYEDGSDN